MLEYFFVISISIYSYKRLSEWLDKRGFGINIKSEKIKDENIENINEDDMERLLQLEDKLKQKIKRELDKDKLGDSSKYLEKLKEINQRKHELLKEQKPEILRKGKKLLNSLITYIKKRKK